MNVTIIGAGNMARGIATRALAGNSQVQFLTPELDEAQKLSDELGDGTTAGTVGEKITGDIVVFAIPYGAVQATIDAYADQLADRVVIDITNPVNFDTFEPIRIEAGSAAREIANAVPGARVVKAFNTTFAGTLVAGEVAGRKLDVLIASDDAEAKATVTRLVTDGGLNAVDAGALDRAHELEAMGYMHISLQETLGTGYGSALKLLA